MGDGGAAPSQRSAQQRSSSSDAIAPPPAPKKVTVHLKAVGNAPAVLRRAARDARAAPDALDQTQVLAKARWRFDGERPFAWLQARVMKLWARAASHAFRARARRTRARA